MTTEQQPLEKRVACVKIGTALHPFKRIYFYEGHDNCFFCKYDPIKNPKCLGYAPPSQVYVLERGAKRGD